MVSGERSAEMNLIVKRRTVGMGEVLRSKKSLAKVLVVASGETLDSGQMKTR
jgi:hypothetical protein